MLSIAAFALMVSTIGRLREGPASWVFGSGRSRGGGQIRQGDGPAHPGAARRCAAGRHANWTGPLIAKMLGDVHVQYVWRFLRAQKIDLSGRTRRVCNRQHSRHSRRRCMASASTARSCDRAQAEASAWPNRKPHHFAREHSPAPRRRARFQRTLEAVCRGGHTMTGSLLVSGLVKRLEAAGYRALSTPFKVAAHPRLRTGGSARSGRRRMGRPPTGGRSRASLAAAGLGRTSAPRPSRPSRTAPGTDGRSP